MKTPFLTTNFTESGKRVKNRFANILNTKMKRCGAVVLLLAVLISGVCAALVACKREVKTTEIVPGDTVVLIRDVQISEDITAKKGDLVFVIYDEKDTYHIQLPYMSHPAIYGTVEKTAVSKAADKLAQANHASIKPLGNVYENKGDVKPQTYYSMRTPLTVLSREGAWTEVSFAAGVDNVWVKSKDIDPIIPSTQVDLDYLQLQRKVDAGQDSWRLSPYAVINDYLASRPATKDIHIREDRLEPTSANTISYVDEGFSISVYQPIKKDETGIWVVSSAALRRGQMEDVLPEGTEVKVNSGMGWRIRVEENRMIYTPDSKVSWSVETLAERMGINAADYYGKDIDILIFEYIAPKGDTAYMFLFDDEQLIGHYELDTPTRLETAKQALIHWTEGRK